MDDSTKNMEYRRANYASEEGEIVIRKHEYDGIQEFDQKLPNWWLFTLFAAIIFFLIYWFVYYQTGLMKTDQQNTSDGVAAVFEKKKALLMETLETLDDNTLVHKWSTDPAIVAEGASLYATACIACHGPKLDAPQKLGLSLVDHEWKYGGSPMEIFKLINEGTPPESKGMAPSGGRMIPWGTSYTPDQIAKLVAYLISKAPEDFAQY